MHSRTGMQYYITPVGSVRVHKKHSVGKVVANETSFAAREFSVMKSLAQVIILRSSRLRRKQFKQNISTIR